MCIRDRCELAEQLGLLGVQRLADGVEIWCGSVPGGVHDRQCDTAGADPMPPAPRSRRLETARERPSDRRSTMTATASTTTVTLLGTGMVGAAMAATLARAGFDLRVRNRSRDRPAPLADVGAQVVTNLGQAATTTPVSYTHLRAHETVLDLVCRLLL